MKQWMKVFSSPYSFAMSHNLNKCSKEECREFRCGYGRQVRIQANEAAAAAEKVSGQYGMALDGATARFARFVDDAHITQASYMGNVLLSGS